MGSNTLLKDPVVLKFFVDLVRQKKPTTHEKSLPDPGGAMFLIFFEFGSFLSHRLPCYTGYVDHDGSSNDAPRLENLLLLDLLLCGC